MSHVTHRMRQVTCEWVMAGMNELCNWGMSHIWMSHVTHRTRHFKYSWVMAGTSHVTCRVRHFAWAYSRVVAGMNKSWKWGMSGSKGILSANWLCLREYWVLMETVRDDNSSPLPTSAVTRHVYAWDMSHVWMSHVTSVKRSWWMSHVTYMNETCHMYEWAMSHVWKGHDEWVMSLTWMRHVTCMN